MSNTFKTIHSVIGVDNGVAAPIIWLVIILQKWRAFRRPKQFYLANSELTETHFHLSNHFEIFKIC